MKKIYFREFDDISNELEKTDWLELKSRFTPGGVYPVLEVNYITQKNHKPSVKSYLIKNDFGIAEWVYGPGFLTKNERRDKIINNILQ